MSEIDWSKYFPQYISGICKCGHDWDDHHLGAILNSDALDYLHKHHPDHPPYLAEECEYYGCNETGGKGPDGEEHCERYIDRET